MGIKNLNKFLKETVPEAFIEIPLSSFSGNRLAVDIFQWFHANISVATKEAVQKIDVVSGEKPNRVKIFNILMRNFFSKIRQLLKAKIVPVFVFDGAAPIEKEQTKEDRKQTRLDRTYQIQQLQNNLQTIPEINRPTDLLEKLRTLVGQDIHFSEYEISGIKEILHNLGLPFVQAKGEAEQAGAALCREGYCFGLWTTDTDSLAHGAPIQVREITKQKVNPQTGIREPYLEITSLPIILRKLNFSLEMWQDYCIACGTDYNPNMPDKSSKRCFDLIKQHRRIERFPSSLPIHMLNHYRGRQLFHLCSSSVCIDGWSEQILDIKPGQIMQARNVFESYDLGDYLTSLHEFFFENNILVRDSQGEISCGIVVNTLGETRYPSDGEPYHLVPPLVFSLKGSPKVSPSPVPGEFLSPVTPIAPVTPIKLSGGIPLNLSFNLSSTSSTPLVSSVVTTSSTSSISFTSFTPLVSSMVTTSIGPIQLNPTSPLQQTPTPSTPPTNGVMSISFN